MKKNKIFAFLVIMTFIMSIPVAAHAQTPTSAQTPASQKENLKDEIQSGFENYLTTAKIQINSTSPQSTLADFINRNPSYLNLLNQYTNITIANDKAMMSSMPKVAPIATTGSVYKTIVTHVNGTLATVDFINGTMDNGQFYTMIKINGNNTDPWLEIINDPLTISLLGLNIQYGEDQYVALNFSPSEGLTFIQNFTAWEDADITAQAEVQSFFSLAVGVIIPQPVGFFVAGVGELESVLLSTATWISYSEAFLENYNANDGLWILLENVEIDTWFTNLGQPGAQTEGYQTWSVFDFQTETWEIIPNTNPNWAYVDDADCEAFIIANAIDTAGKQYGFNQWVDVPLDSAWIIAGISSDPPLNIGCSSSLLSVADEAAPIFYEYYDNLPISSANPIGTVNITQDSDHDVFLGVLNGTYDVGFVDRLPNPGENNSNTHLYAIGYNGDLIYNSNQNPNPTFDLSNVLWMVTNGPPQQADGMFISYVRNLTSPLSGDKLLDGTGYSPLNPCDFIPDGIVNFHDIQTFVGMYISYFSNNLYYPYADFNADGVINFHDICLFVAYYIAYYSTDDLQPVGGGGSLGFNSGQDGSNQTVLSLNGPSVLPCVGSSFNVTLNVNNVAGLWSWGTGATWNPSVLALTDIAEGPFLQSAGSTMFLNSLGDPLVLSNGVLRDMGDAIMSSSSVSGSGTLATLTFQVLSNEPVNITLTGSELDSPDTGSGIQVIPCTVNNLQIQPLPPPTGYFTPVQPGTTNEFWSVGPTPNPLNTTIGVDVTITDASNVWGWTIPTVTWNLRILQLTGVTEGSFLASNTGGNPTVMTGNSPSLFDNVHGAIIGGLSEDIQGAGTSTESSGVVATLWFNITGNGIADINLAGAKLYAGSNDNVGTNAYALNGTVTVNTPSHYIFSDGFESGDFSMWNRAYGEPSSVGPQIPSAEAHTGQYSAYFPAEPANDFACLGTDFSPQSTLDFRFYMNLAAKSGNGFDNIVAVDANNGDQMGIDVNLATGQFEVWYYNNNYDEGYSYESSAQNVAANSWFCLELALTPTTFTLYYNGASIVTGTFPDGATGQFIDANIEPMACSAPFPAFYIDDVIVSTSYVGP